MGSANTDQKNHTDSAILHQKSCGKPNATTSYHLGMVNMPPIFDDFFKVWAVFGIGCRWHQDGVRKGSEGEAPARKDRCEGLSCEGCEGLHLRQFPAVWRFLWVCFWDETGRHIFWGWSESPAIAIKASTRFMPCHVPIFVWVETLHVLDSLKLRRF